MVISTSPQQPPSQALIEHLRQGLGLSEKALSLGLRQAEQEQAPLPVVLWRFGLISLIQLDELLHWQDGQEGAPDHEDPPALQTPRARKVAPAMETTPAARGDR
ncbi:MAG: hypothetical protein RLZZ624_1008 [Cyanobacteriota bacterium]|jgi:hypothetical protein